MFAKIKYKKIIFLTYFMSHKSSKSILHILIISISCEKTLKTLKFILKNNMIFKINSLKIDLNQQFVKHGF